MYAMKTEEDWLEVYVDQDKKIREVDPLWIPTLDLNKLPPKDVWVQLLENDELNPQDKFIMELQNKPTIRVIVGMFKCLDLWGNPQWYKGFVGGSFINVGRNVSHWQHLAKAPSISSFPYE
jgi:hypothetical protein